MKPPVHRYRNLLLCCSVLLATGGVTGLAQEGGERGDSVASLLERIPPPSHRLSLGFSLGVTLTRPSGDFPSLLFVTSEDSTGVASSERGTTGIASRWVLSLYFPITGRFGGVLEGGSRVWSIRYGEGATSRAVRMDLQTSFIALLGRMALIEPSALFPGATTFIAGVEGGIEFGFGPYRNLVVTTIPADSSGQTLAPVEGSFQGGDPFCGQTGLTGGIWGGLTVGESIDLRIGASLLHPFPELFSRDAIEGNDARISQFSVDLGVNYSF